MKVTNFSKSIILKTSGFLFIFSLSFLIKTQGQSFGSIEVKGSYHQLFGTGYAFLIDDRNVQGGRFYVSEFGNVGIGMPKGPGPNSWPNPLEKLHLMGNAILGGNILISKDPQLAVQWKKLSLENDPQWGLWLDKGVVATDYAIAKPVDWADYVFDENYRLRPLSEVEMFIKANKHLPEIPSQQKIQEEGYTVHSMNTNFMQKIEELTLYAIAQDKQIKQLEEQLKRQEQLVQELMTRVKRKK